MPYPKKLIVLFSFLFVFLLSFSGYAWAINLPFINKSKIRVSVPVGQQAYGEIIVENPTPETRSIRLYLEDWHYVAGGDGSKEFAPAGTLSYSCAPWITFSPSEFTILPFSRQRVSYSIKAPAQAAGGYYAVLFFETAVGKVEAPEGKTGAGINLNIRIASLFYVEIEGTIKRKALINNLTVKKDIASGQLLIAMDLYNKGNVDIAAGGTFHIMDKKGMVYARGEFNDVYTFPEDKAKLTAAWKESMPKGKYDLIFTFNLGKALEEVGFGRGPVVTKESEIEIDASGELIKVGELK